MPGLIAWGKKMISEWGAAAANKLTDINPFYDFNTMELKQEGINSLMNTLLVSFGDMLSVRNLPGEDTIVKKFGTDNVYLSRNKAEELVKLLTVSRSNLNGSGTEGALLVEYRRLGLEQLSELLKELNVYIGTFDVLATGKTGKIFKKKITYKDVLDVKKRMYDSLKKLINIASSKKYDGMTFECVAKELVPKFYGKYTEYCRENAADTLAVKGVRKCIDILNDNCTKHLNDTGWNDFFAQTNYNDQYKKLLELVGQYLNDASFKKLSKALKYTRGLGEGGTIIQHSVKSKNDKSCKVNHKAGAAWAEIEIKKSVGYQDLLEEVKSKIEKAKTGFTIGKMAIPTVLLGDAMKKLNNCFDYTLKQLNKALGTGDKDSVAASIDFEKLLGDSGNTSGSSEKAENIKRTEKVLVSQKDFEKMISMVKKMYDKLSKVEKDLKLKEKLPLSKSNKEGQKTLEDHYNDLTVIMNDARKKIGSNERNEQNNLYALYFRKGSRFLRMCEEYAVYLDREKVNRKNNEKNNIANAKIFIAEAKNHYKELQKALKSNHSGWSKRGELKTRLNVLDKEYAKVPTSPSAFAKDSNNITKYETFMGVNVNTIENAASTAEEASGKGAAKK